MPATRLTAIVGITGIAWGSFAAFRNSYITNTFAPLYSIIAVSSLLLSRLGLVALRRSQYQAIVHHNASCRLTMNAAEAVVNKLAESLSQSSLTPLHSSSRGPCRDAYRPVGPDGSHEVQQEGHKAVPLSGDPPGRDQELRKKLRTAGRPRWKRRAKDRLADQVQQVVDRLPPPPGGIYQSLVPLSWGTDLAGDGFWEQVWRESIPEAADPACGGRLCGDKQGRGRTTTAREALKQITPRAERKRWQV